MSAFQEWHSQGDPVKALQLRQEYEEGVTREGNLLSYAERDSRNLAQILDKGQFDETGYMVGALGACTLLQKAASVEGRILPDISTVLSEYQKMRLKTRQNAPGDNEKDRVFFDMRWQKRIVSQALNRRIDAAKHFIMGLPANNEVGKESAVYGFAEGLYLYGLTEAKQKIHVLNTTRDDIQAA